MALRGIVQQLAGTGCRNCRLHGRLVRTRLRLNKRFAPVHAGLQVSVLDPSGQPLRRTAFRQAATRAMPHENVWLGATTRSLDKRGEYM